MAALLRTIARVPRRAAFLFHRAFEVHDEMTVSSASTGVSPARDCGGGPAKMRHAGAAVRRRRVAGWEAMPRSLPPRCWRDLTAEFPPTRRPGAARQARAYGRAGRAPSTRSGGR